MKDWCLTQIALLILRAKKDYYSGHPFLTDAEYDSIELMLSRACPDHPVLGMVGWDPSYETAVREWGKT